MSDESYPGEADEAAAAEAACEQPMLPPALTREQVEERIQWYGENFVLYRTRWANELLDTDAALRTTITQQAQELDILEKEAVSYKRVIESNQKEFSKLEQQLAAMTQERDELNIAVTSGIRHRQEYVERIDALVIELAAMTRERDEAIASHSQTVTAFMYLQKQYDHLQATLVAREDLIHGLETELEEYRNLAEKLGAEKAVSERDIARQNAARMRALIKQVVNDLPAKRDWLDPDLEKALKGT